MGSWTERSVQQDKKGANMITKMKARTIAMAVALMMATAAHAQISDQQIKDFFAGNPTPDQIASAASDLGMNVNQIAEAMAIANYGSNLASREKAIKEWVGNQNNGYSWGAGGQLVANNPSSGAALGTNAFGKGAAWANGSTRVCPEGMTVGANRAGIPRCIGTPTRNFPTGEAVINASAAQGLGGTKGAIWVDPRMEVVAPAVAAGTAQGWNGRGPQGSLIPTAGFLNGMEGVVDGTASSAILTNGHGIITPAMIRDFFATNPSQEEQAAMAKKYGLADIQIKEAIGIASLGTSNVPTGQIWDGYKGVNHGGQVTILAGDLMTKSGGVITEQQLKEFYATNPSLEQEQAAMNKYGLTGMDLYKARSIGRQAVYNGGIYGDPRELNAFGVYMRDMQIRKAANIMAFPEWRDSKTSEELRAIRENPANSVGVSPSLW